MKQTYIVFFTYLQHNFMKKKKLKKNKKKYIECLSLSMRTLYAQICDCKGNDRLKNIDYSGFQYGHSHSNAI